MGVPLIKVTAYISKVIITEEISTFPDTEPASIRVRSIFLDGTPICRVGGRTRIDAPVPKVGL
jgi:hypothetical protein